MDDVVEVGTVVIDDTFVDFTIRKDLTVKRERYYEVLKNPFRDGYYTKVLYGSKVDILERKIALWLRKWKQDKEAGIYEKEKREHEEQKQYSGEEDSLPF